MKTTLLLPSLCLVLLGSGCAYKVGAVHDPGFKTIFVENFKSDVDQPQLENMVSTTIIQQFQRDGTLEVTSEERAEVILKGKIVSFETTPVRYSRTNELTPTEVSMTIGVEYSLTKRGESKPYADHLKATGSSSFFIGDDLQSDKKQGVPIAAARLGQAIVAKIVDGW